MRLATQTIPPLLLLWSGAVEASGEPFDVLEIPTAGRTVAAEIADLNGDGRGDLLQVVFAGMPPNERRSLRVFLQSPEGTFSSLPSFERPLPDGTAAYDVADVLEVPGTELVLLQPRGVSIVSLSSPNGAVSRIDFPAGTVAAAADERGLESVKLVWAGIRARPTLLVPQLDAFTIATPEGRIIASLRVEGRANYFVPPREGLWLLESDLQLYFDTPRVAVGDVDGDGRADVVASARHALRVFLQRENGEFASEPDRVLALGRLSEQDHIRGAGGVSVQARDLDGDHKLDLLVSHVHGGFSDTQTVSTLHLNRGGGWDLARADQSFESRGKVGSDVLIDLNSDGRPELARVEIPFSVLELVEALLTRSIDAEVSLRRFAERRFEDEPYARMKLGVPISFETFRSKGFLPTLWVDLDADGIRDLVTSGSGDRIEVFPGGSDDPYRRPAARQKLDTRSRARFGDLDGDRRDDLVIFDPHRPGAPLRLARNRGTLAAPRGPIE